MEIRDVATFLDYLGSVHGRTRRVVLCIPPSDIEWGPGSGRFTFGDVVRHLAGIERWMYAETIQGKQSRYPGHGVELASGFDGVLAYYDRLHEQARAIFARLDSSALSGKSFTPAGTPVSTWKWLRSMIEHEAHHRGQLYLMLGMHGIETPPIYGLTSEEVHARSLVP